MTDEVAVQNFNALKSKSFDIRFDLKDTYYKAIENIGTGAYGVVCSATHVLTKEMVAIKKIPDIFGQPTIAKRTYREIKILKHFKHDNVIAIREILKPKGQVEDLRDVYIVLDLMETDLHRIIHSKQELTEEHVRYFLYQILRGLKYIHSAHVIHRDLKPSNLLVNENCDLKIGDFGMARGVSSDPEGDNNTMTQYVATRWYRAPELMLTKVDYTGAVDMWSVGCIFAEMLGRKQIFPGKNLLDQLKKIIDVIGTPPKEFLKLHDNNIQSVFLKLSETTAKKSTPLHEKYPKASSKAKDLLKQMLHMNPGSRICVEQALGHPFLNKYHDPQDEPICVPVFDFSFEKEDMSLDELKRAIIKEIMDYHPVIEKPKVPFNFRPVPKSEIQAKSNSPQKASPLKSDNFVCGDKDANFGLNAFLYQLRGTDKENKSHSLQSQNDIKSTYNNIGQPLSFLSTNSPTSDSEFKVPVGLPIVKQKNLLQVKPETQTEDIEMLSAKSSGLSVQTDAASHPDVEMLSANKAQPFYKLEEKIMIINESGAAKSEPAVEKTINAKEALKAAILSAALRKQKGGQESKSRPMTALQRQREREEKKKKKMEKAMERKKKQKQKEKSSAIMLSDDDKNLLARWATMQNRASTPAITASSGVASVSTNPSTPSQSTAAIRSSISTEPNNSTQLPNLKPASHTKYNTPMMGLFQSKSEAIVTTMPRNVSEGSVVSNTSPVNSHMVQINPQAVVTPAMQGNVVIINSNTSDKASCVGVSEMAGSGTLMRNTMDSIQMTQPTTVQITQPYTYSVASEVDNLSPLTNPLDSILDELENNSPSTESKQPPSYNEALQAKLETLSPPQADARTSPLMSDNTSQPFLPFQTYQSDDHDVQAMYPTDVNLDTASTSLDLNQKEPSILSVITRQLGKSHMDDLTLMKTPKGTGGTGYGVGYDLESLMAGAEAPVDRSAPLSATESLLGDWQEVGIDAKEYEAIEKELGISPCINFGDMVTTPS